MPFATISMLGGWILGGVLIALSLVMMFIILIQRGKGGGLAGAFGGAGGSSAFGSRAGDAFTKITLYLAAIWVLVIMISVKTFIDHGTPTAENPAGQPAAAEPAPAPQP